MSTTTVSHAEALPADWRDFVALTKPRVMTLVVFTGLVGVLAAHVPVHPVIVLTIILCIALGAGGAATLNQWYEADLDAKMKRTRKRPLPDGRMDRSTALHFGVGLSLLSVVLLGLSTNVLAAVVLLVSILFYVLVYTVWLKRRTPQNIVIGGAAGAFPPLIGWVAATGRIDALPVLMFGLIFLWTPPHFWALALAIETDYVAAGVPMLPNIAGDAPTRRGIFGYTLLMSAAALAPVALHLTGLIYAVVSAVATLLFVAMAARVALRTPVLGDAMRPERRLFYFSIIYLFALFAALGVDRVLT